MARVQIPAYKLAVLKLQLSANVDSLLIRNQALQIATLRHLNDSTQRIIDAERSKSAEYEKLFGLANAAYRKERNLRRLTLIGSGLVVTGVVLAALF